MSLVNVRFWIALESVCGDWPLGLDSGLCSGWYLRASTAALKRKSSGVDSRSSCGISGRDLGLEGVFSRSLSTSKLSLSCSRVGTRSESGNDLEKKLGIGRAEGAGDAWKVGPA